MLDKLRQHFLRRYLWLVVLFGSLAMQSENLYACGLLDSGPQTTCCCDKNMEKGCHMGGGCETSVNNSILSAGCCDISTQLNVGLQTLASSDSHQDLQVALLDAPQPPPAPAVVIYTPATTANTKDTLIKIYLVSSPASYGVATYLITQRFRV